VDTYADMGEATELRYSSHADLLERTRLSPLHHSRFPFVEVMEPP